MKKTIRFLAALFACGLPLQQAFPDDLPAACFNHKVSVIHVLFSAAGPDPMALKKKFDSDIHTIEAQAMAAGASRMIVGGMTYTLQPGSSYYSVIPFDGPININENGLKRMGQAQGFQFSGQVNFDTAPADQATALLQILTGKGWNATLSMVESNTVPGRCPFNPSTGRWE